MLMLELPHVSTTASPAASAPIKVALSLATLQAKSLAQGSKSQLGYLLDVYCWAISSLFDASASPYVKGAKSNYVPSRVEGRN